MYTICMAANITSHPLKWFSPGAMPCVRALPSCGVSQTPIRLSSVTLQVLGTIHDLLLQLEQAELLTGRADNTRGQLALSTPPS